MMSLRAMASWAAVTCMMVLALSNAAGYTLTFAGEDLENGTFTFTEMEGGGVSLAKGMSCQWTALGDSGSYSGTSISSAGDVNGDGHDDVIIGGYYYSGGQGKAYVYLGSSRGLDRKSVV